MEYWKSNFRNYTHKPSGRSKAASAPCKKHPKHRQSPGVCSICLSEKLSQSYNFNDSNPRAKPARSPSSSSSSSDLSSLSSSNASSACSSPFVSYTRRMDSKVPKFKRGCNGDSEGQNVLNKSRSMAFVQRHNEENDNVGIKRGFWSKLMPERKKGLVYSRTVTERIIAAIH